jgi:hypothetical protein
VTLKTKQISTLAVVVVVAAEQQQPQRENGRPSQQ